MFFSQRLLTKELISIEGRAALGTEILQGKACTRPFAAAE